MTLKDLKSINGVTIRQLVTVTKINKFDEKMALLFSLIIVPHRGMKV